MSDDQAWAQGTHVYRPMGCAVIAKNGQFRAPDFHRFRRSPGRNSPLFVGLFGSLEEVNVFLASPRPRIADIHTRLLIE